MFQIQKIYFVFECLMLHQLNHIKLHQNLKTLEQKVSKENIIVCGNKIDIKDSKVLTGEIQKDVRFKYNVKYYYLSVKACYNIPTIYNIIIKY